MLVDNIERLLDYGPIGTVLLDYYCTTTGLLLYYYCTARLFI